MFAFGIKLFRLLRKKLTLSTLDYERSRFITKFQEVQVLQGNERHTSII